MLGLGFMKVWLAHLSLSTMPTAALQLNREFAPPMQEMYSSLRPLCLNVRSKNIQANKSFTGTLDAHQLRVLCRLSVSLAVNPYRLLCLELFGTITQGKDFEGLSDADKLKAHHFVAI